MSDFLEVIFIIIMCSIIILFVSTLIVFIIGIPITSIEVKTFNKLHNTEYTTLEFFFNKETLRYYHGRSVTLKGGE